MTALLAMLGTKAAGWIASVLAGAVALGAWWLVGRRSGVQAERRAGTERELQDRRTADAIEQQTAREPDPKAALKREFGR